MSGLVTHLRIRQVELATRTGLAAAHDRAPDPVRRLIYVSTHVGDSSEPATGWGECSALNTVGYTHESVDTVWATLTGSDPRPLSTQPMAAAGVRMALADHRLRLAGVSLSEQLGTQGRSAVAGAVVGLGPTAERRHEVEQLVADGFRHIKLKIDASTTAADIASIVAGLPGVDWHVDANGSLHSDNLPMLIGLSELGVSAIEQPFAPREHELATQLVAATAGAVIADEGAVTATDIEQLADRKTATAVAVKPPRAGGIDHAVALAQTAARCGLAVSIGGMVESGLGRHSLAALAAHPEITAGDLSPAGRWLAEDPFTDLTVVDGRIAAPTGIGIAGDPDLELLEWCTRRVEVIALDALDWG